MLMLVFSSFIIHNLLLFGGSRGVLAGKMGLSGPEGGLSTFKAWPLFLFKVDFSLGVKLGYPYRRRKMINSFGCNALELFPSMNI